MVPQVENGASLRDLLDTCGTSLIWPQTYAASMGYDTLNRRILWHGTPHGGAGLTIKYDVATNLWTTEARPGLCNGTSVACNVGPPDNQSQDRCADCSARHAYDGVTCDGAGHMFAQATDNRIWDFNGTSWSSFATTPSGSSTGAMVFWPSLGTQGSLVALSNYQNEVWRYDLSSRAWTKISNITLGNTYHGQIEYHPTSDLIWIQSGNGTTQHYRLSLVGGTPTLASLGSAPSDRLGMTDSKCAADPSSTSAFICWDMSEDTEGSSSTGWYAYDIANNTWSSLASQGISSMPPLYSHRPDLGSSPVTVAVLPDMGVTVWLVAERDDRSGSGGMFVYKHGPGSQQIPPVPANVRAN